jgi:hypothetical protein
MSTEAAKTNEAIYTLADSVSDLEGAWAVISGMKGRIFQLTELLEKVERELFWLAAQSSSMEEVQHRVAHIRERLTAFHTE